MFEIFGKLRAGLIFWVLVLCFSFPATASAFAETSCQAGEHLDKTKYISIDEIRPGMEAYCLTAYKGTEIEKFDLEVLDVVRNINPGGYARPGSRNAILVCGTDERFIHTGPVSGCSGSPVYVDGRLAGALSFGWIFSKDPLYGVTPIEEMLSVGEVSYPERSGEQAGFAFDFSAPIDFAAIDKQITTPRLSRQPGLAGAAFLPCPLVTSGLPGQAVEQLNGLFEPFGLMVISGIGGGTAPVEGEDVQLAPGACLAVPLVTGDITMAIIGTVTDVVGDKVYGFGHGLLGYGPMDLPMATGRVHTVVSSVIRSFKFASALEIVGALRTDVSTAVCGRLGAKARMIPLTITVDRYNGAEKRVYNCQVADNRLLTPLVLRSAVTGAALMLGVLPPDHTIEYKVNIGIEGAESINFENISSNMGLDEMIIESVGPVAILMNNPYKRVDIRTLDFDVRIVPKNITSRIWSVDLSDSKVKCGQQLDVFVVVESVLAGKKKYQCSLKIPEELASGRYDLIVCGGYGYQEFLKQAVPYKFIPQNLATLVDAMNELLAIRRDRLYCLLVLPAGGVAVEKAELPDLPATKALVLQDSKRTLRTQPYSHWLEKSLETGTVVVGKKVTHITVGK